MKNRFTLACTALGLLALPASAAAKWKSHPIKVTPGVPMRASDIRPYEPPKLGEEPPLEPTDVKVIEITVPEVTIQVRPWSSPMVGNAVDGARLPVRGVVTAKKGGCQSKLWYAVEPFGYVCARSARPSDDPPSTEQVLLVADGERLPFHYAMVHVKEGEKVPLWTTLDDLKRGADPERQLEKGDTVAVEKTYTWEGEKYWISVEGKVMPQKGSAQMGGGSEWQGLTLTDATPLPFGWVTPDTLKAYAAPMEKVTPKTESVATFSRRTRLKIEEEQLLGKRRWLRVTVADSAAPAAAALALAAASAPVAAAASAPEAGALWVSADLVNEVRLLERPDTVAAAVTHWIDVDLGEQVLVAYEGVKPVFATLVSSGRAIATPMGTYPVWAKVSAITMKNQPYEDKGYFVNKVPWSTFFQWHNAIHGAYWHDKFGITKSHGCVNVAPLDARHIFEWVSPPLPAGWTGLRPLDLLASPHVVVRNSKMKKQFRQDRPIGPPDRELEGQRLQEAEARRAEEAAAAASAQAIPVPAPPAATTPSP